MAGGWFADTRCQYCPAYRFLDQAWINVMTSLFSCGPLAPASGLREHPLLSPLHGRIGVFPCQGVGQCDASPAIGQGLLVECPHRL